MCRVTPARRLFAALATSLVLAGPAESQVRGPAPAVLDRPVYQGHAAHAPVPAKLHVKNEAGSNGLGLCVISSVLSDGLAQQVPGLNIPGPGESNLPGRSDKVSDAPGKGSQLWRLAKARPGGYDPYKLPELIEEIYGSKDRAPAGATYVNIQSKDVSVLQTLTHKGIPVGITVDNGSHMVSLDEFTVGGVAIWHDNNDPARWHAEPASTFVQRITCPPTGLFWAFAWTKPIPSATADGTFIVLGLIGAGGIILFFTLRRRDDAAKPDYRTDDTSRDLLLSRYAPDRPGLP